MTPESSGKVYADNYLNHYNEQELCSMLCLTDGVWT